MILCHCKKCQYLTAHRYTGARGPEDRIYCEVCGQVRWYALRFGAGDFPELSEEENEIVHEARALGFGASFICYPDAEAQARRTLRAARRFLAR